MSRSASFRDDSARLDDLYRAEAPGLTRRLLRRLRSPEDARDLVQDAFVHLARSGQIGRLRQPRSFLNTIVRNLVIDRARSLVNRTEHTSLVETIEAAPDTDPAYQLEVKELGERYRASVAALPPKMKQVFMMSRVEDLEYEEIADRLDISVKTVRWHLTEAIVRIDKALKDD